MFRTISVHFNHVGVNGL